MHVCFACVICMVEREIDRPRHRRRHHRHLLSKMASLNLAIASRINPSFTCFGGAGTRAETTLLCYQSETSPPRDRCHQSAVQALTLPEVAQTARQ